MSSVSTPVNTVSRDNLIVLLRNNVLNTSLEFNDSDVMETDSPVRKPTSTQPIIKKLFHSPITPQSPEELQGMKKISSSKERRRKRKRKELLLDSDEKIKMAYVKERDNDSPDGYGMRKRVLISLFHNKEYSMDMESLY